MKTKNERGKIVSAAVCCGKSYLGEHYPNVLDLESTPFNYLLTPKQKLMDNEKLKGMKKKKNPNFLTDYIEAIKKAMEEYDIVLVAPGTTIRQALKANNLPYILVYPASSCKEEYVARAKKRGNNENFINRLKNEFGKDDFAFDTYASRHIVLNPGEYLEDGLLREGILSRN